jgi:hypothetical protein
MPMVYHKLKPYRTQFRKLARGQGYWLATNLATAPAIKTDRRSSLGGWSTTTGAPTLTAVSDTSVAVVRVPTQFMGQNDVNE